MGARGPIPLSVDDLEARGSTLAKRRRARVHGSKSAKAVAPIRCPSWLDAEAAAEWRRIVAGLRPFGILRPTDATALGRYCELWTLWRKLIEARDAAPVNDVTCIRLERRALKVSVSLLALEDKFGLNPASRARLNLPLQVAAPTTTDLKMRFFQGLIPSRGEAN